MKTCITIILCLVSATAVARSASPSSGGLVPCKGSGGDGYADVVDAVINTPNIGNVVVSFTALHSFAQETGVRVVQTGETFVLRSVEFDHSVWYSGYKEVSPGTFERDPAEAHYERSVHEVSLSPEVANLLRQVVAREVRGASKANERFGLDGSTYYFSSDGLCASAWTPEWRTPADRLIDVFMTLQTQASVPTRWGQLFWERRAFAQLLALAGRPPMSADSYILVLAIGLLIIAVAALPFIVASVLMLLPRLLKRKRLFVVVSGTLSYGFTCAVGLLLLPFFLAATHLSLSDADDARLSFVALAIVWISDTAPITVFASWLVLSLAVPTYLRLVWWPKITDATQQAFAGDVRNARA